MIDPKVAAGGVAVVAIGGGTGYAIHQGISGTNETPTATPERKLSQIKTTPKGGSYAEKIKNAGFELLTEETTNDSNWSEIITANTQSGNTPKKEELQKRCVNLLETTYSGTTIPEEYKEAVKKCTKKEGLKEKLGRLGLDVLAEEDHNTLNGRWNTMASDNGIKEELKKTPYSFDLTATGKTTYTEQNAKDLIKKCETYSTNNHSYTSNIETKWKRYLTLCSKDKGNKTYDSVKDLSYWTNEAVTTATGQQ